MRLFVAVDPGAEVIAGVERAMAALRPKAPDAKWVTVESLHGNPSTAGVTSLLRRRRNRAGRRLPGCPPRGYAAAQQRLYFLPEPQGQGPERDGVGEGRGLCVPVGRRSTAARTSARRRRSALP